MNNFVNKSVNNREEKERNEELEAQASDLREMNKWLHASAITGDVETLRRLLAEGVPPDARVWDPTFHMWGNTPLMDAVSHGRKELVRLLLEAGADIHAADDDMGETVCSYAFCLSNPIPMLELLFEYGLELEADGGFGNTPLMLAAGDGKAAAVRWLLARGADIHARDDDARTPLMHAVLAADADMIQLLLEHGARLHERDFRGQGVISLALRVDRRDLEELLAAERAASIYWHHANYVEDREETLDLLRLLLSLGAEADGVDCYGWSPLLLALACGQGKAARLLLEHGASLAGHPSGMVERARLFASCNHFFEAVALIDELMKS